MRIILTALVLAGMAGQGFAKTPTARAINHVGDVGCGYSGDQKAFTISVGHGLSTDEVAVVFNQQWNWLQRAPAPGGMVIHTTTGRTTVTIPIDTVARRSGIQIGGRVFPRPGDYSIRIGSSLDSEDNIDIVACRYIFSR
jgi:hypothetical protein